MSLIPRSYVLRSDGSRREVKNLGWLLKHRAEVAHFNVRTEKTLPAGTVGRFGAILTAQIGKGDGALTYRTEFNSRDILRDFLSRPSWRGLRCYWDDQPETIGKRGQWTRAGWDKGEEIK